MEDTTSSRQPASPEYTVHLMAWLLHLGADHLLPTGPPMQSDSGHTHSSWEPASDIPGFTPLAADLTTDVCVIGAGIAGLSVAYQLARSGRRVVVLDDGPVGGGESSRTTAHLASALDDRFYRIEKLHGEEGARIGAESHRAAIEAIGEIVRTEGIECDFERLDGYLFLTPTESESDLDRELEAARRAGLTVEKVAQAPLEMFDTGPALRFRAQGQFHPLKYLAGLARAIVAHGGHIHTGTRATEVKDGRPCTVRTESGRTVTANSVAVCTNTPFIDLVVMHTKQAAYRTFVVAGVVPEGTVAPALYWDTGDPYHYVRLQRRDGEDPLLIVGGEDHKTGQADDAEERFRRLEEWARDRFPVREFTERWSGQVMEPIDYMGFIGRNPGDNHVYIATGDSGQGMTHGTIAGLLIRDLVLGVENPWARLYNPGRKTPRGGALLAFAKENLNLAAQYVDWVRGGDVSTPDEIPAGEGAVLQRGLTKVACYRDADGTVHERSAVCTHLFCVVQWNSTEKSWDCPCHGSRFDPYGRVVNGPAVIDLADATRDEGE